METRIADLEVRLTYQESTLEALNAVIIKQQSQIDVLQSHIEHLRSQLAGQTDPVAASSDEILPPHY